ncbi:hypothetical protein KEJ47_09450 [Candidatus Bathyarchaeota archaeon]|nr:hypothetical protein [Candidatus Bathyarchaeota archaeon]
MGSKRVEYLRKARQYWLVIGTILLLPSWIGGFESSPTYMLAILIVWLVFVGWPIIILKKIEKRVSKCS